MSVMYRTISIVKDFAKIERGDYELDTFCTFEMCVRLIFYAKVQKDRKREKIFYNAIKKEFFLG